MNSDILLTKEELMQAGPVEGSLKIKAAFAQRFKKLRTAKGYTQLRLAQILHVSRSCLCAWEHGKRMPDMRMFVAICDIFNVSCGYMLGVEPLNKYEINSKDLFICSKSKFLDVSKLNDKNLYDLFNYYRELLLRQYRSEDLEKKRA